MTNLGVSINASKVSMMNPYIIGLKEKLNINVCNIYMLIIKKYIESVEELQNKLSAKSIRENNIIQTQKGFLDLVDTEKLIIYGTRINFTDKCWDFSEHYEVGKYSNRYKFHIIGSRDEFQMEDYYKIILKLYLFNNLSEEGIVGKTHGNFMEIRKFFSYLSINNIVGLNEVTVDIINNYIAKRKMIYTTEVKVKRILKEFYVFFSLLAENIYTNELREYFEEVNFSLVKAINLENKQVLLPSHFYEEYRELLKEILNDCKRSTEDRTLAGLLYVGTQTGLRESELAILKEDSLQEFEYQGKKIGILNYRSTKNGSKNRTYSYAKAIASVHVIEVINIINYLNKEDRASKSSELLCINRRRGKSNKLSANNLAYPGSRLHKFSLSLCIKYHERLGTLNSLEADSFECKIDQTTMKRKFSTLFKEMNFKTDDIIYALNIIQLRVYYASELRKRGIDDRIIAALLNHESPEMRGYYSRPSKTIQEDIDFSKEIVMDIVRDEYKILGEKGDAIRNKIDAIIMENNLNVKKDLNEIINMVCEEMPIRAKEGGFCIKSNPRRECRHDANTDEFLCAYGICANHCHFFYMVNITYQKYLDIIKTIDYNEKAGYINQSQKEMYKLEAIINQELSIEINDLEREIERKGIDLILERYSDLKFIADNRGSIKEDMYLWMQKIETMKQ